MTKMLISLKIVIIAKLRFENFLFFVKLIAKFIQNAVETVSNLVVWKLRKLSLTLFSQKIRESIAITKEIIK